MSQLPKLYDLAHDYAVLATLADTDDLPPEVIRDTLEGLHGNITEKSTNIAKFMLGLEAEAEAILAAAEAIKRRGERRKRRAESIKNYMLFCLQAAGVTRVDCAEFTIAVQANPAAVEVSDEKAVPDEYWRQPELPPKVLDKDKIKADLKAKKTVAGCWLRQGEHLRIRI